MVPRIAVVPPRFGRQVVGGAEALSREIALALAGRGWEVEVLTTCATSHFTWANELPPGDGVEDGVVVRRFPNVQRSTLAGLHAQQKIQAEIMPTMDEQTSWMSWRLNVPGLFEHLLREGHTYQAVMFAPYMFWTTAVCLPVVAERAISMPCLHDEFYARLGILRPVLTEPARLWFLSEPEHQLAHQLAPLTAPHDVTGAGVDIPSGYDPDGFRRRYGLERPFLLYAGRREPEKGWNLIADLFAEAVVDYGVDMDLVSMGVGDIDPPKAVADRVIDLGPVSSRDRDDGMAAAAAYVQPSKMESFSRTVMESWLAGTPVLALGTSPVVAYHCERSGGGRTFTDAASLAAALHEVSEDPAAAADMAAKGRQYVLDNYSWPVVLDRIEASLREMA